MRRQIKNIHSDKSLTPQEKQRRIMELMNPNSRFNTVSSSLQNITFSAECSHYQRGCLLQCQECKLFVPCRLCHDAESSIGHNMNRFTVALIKCKTCQKEQSPHPNGKCQNKECAQVFGLYYCDVCHLYENDQTKRIFHCTECGICRIGSKDEYIHCIKCNHCIKCEVISAGEHTCFANTWANDCPICNESLSNSVKPLVLLKCGHGIHQECVQNYLIHDYRCPLCKKSVAQMNWEPMQTALNNMRDNGNVQFTITDTSGEILKKTCLCNDCGNHFTIERNVFSMYSCPSEECGSFNIS